jgi:hypothetical protein
MASSGLKMLKWSKGYTQGISTRPFGSVTTKGTLLLADTLNLTPKKTSKKMT